MARALIGRTIRRLRAERRLTQQALAVQLGISASYLNLIEHDQRTVTASLLIKLGETLQRRPRHAVRPRRTPTGGRRYGRPSRIRCCPPMRCRRRRSPNLAAAAPNAARAVLALYRAWRVAREDAGGIALPSGRRVLLPNEEARDLFDDTRQPFPRARGGGGSDRGGTARHAGEDEPRHRRAPAAHARADGDGAAAGRRAAPLRCRRRAAWRCPRRCRAKAAASTWRSSLPCWRRATRSRRCWPMPRPPRRRPRC